LGTRIDDMALGTRIDDMALGTRNWMEAFSYREGKYIAFSPVRRRLR